MEVLRFPQFVDDHNERILALKRALHAVRTAHCGACIPAVCFVLQVAEPAQGVVRRQLENARKDIDIVRKLLRLSSLVLLGIRVSVHANSDIGKVLRMSSAISLADVLVVQLQDPTALEGLRADAFDLLGQHQLLLVDVDVCLATEASSSEMNKKEECIVDPRAFVLPAKSLPKGRMALFCSYPMWMKCTNTFDGIVELRKRFSMLQRYIVESVRVPLLTGYNGIILSATDAVSLLSLRHLRDVNALLSTLCGGPAVGGVSRNMYAEACGLVTKIFRNSCSVMTSHFLQTLALAQSDIIGSCPPSRRQKRRRQTEDSDDGSSGALELIEDVPKPSSASIR